MADLTIGSGSTAEEVPASGAVLERAVGGGEPSHEGTEVHTAPPSWLGPCRWSIALVLCFLLGTYASLQSQESVLRDVAFGTCESGGPADLQGGPFSATNSEIAEIVTGWYASIRLESALQANATARPPTACSTLEVVPTDVSSADASEGVASEEPAPSTTVNVATAPEPDEPPVLAPPTAGPGLDSALGVALSWLSWDTRWFAGFYGLLLMLVVLYASRYSWTTPKHPYPLLDLARNTASGRGCFFVLGTLWIAVVLDWIENAMVNAKLREWWQLLRSRTANGAAASLDRGDLDRFWVEAIGWAKVVLLIPALFVALRLLADVIMKFRTSWWRQLKTLRVQLVLLVIFGFVWLGPMDQGQDAIRRLSTPQWFAGAAALTVTALVVSVTGAGALRYQRSPGAETEPTHEAPASKTKVKWLLRRPSGAIVIAVGLVLWFASTWILQLTSDAIGLLAEHLIDGWVGWTGESRGLPLLGKIIVAIGAVSLTYDIGQSWSERRGITGEAARSEKRAAGNASAPAVADAGQPVPPATRVAPSAHLAGLMPLLFGLATIGASAGDLVYAGEGTNRAPRLLVGFAFVCASVVVVAVANVTARWLDSEQGSNRIRGITLAAVSALFAMGAVMHSPTVNLRVADELGTLVILCVFLGGLALLPSIANFVTESLANTSTKAAYGRSWARQVLAHVVRPSVFRLLRIESTPVIGILVVWAAWATTVPLDGYHSIRRLSEYTAASLDRTELAENWASRQAPGTGPRPALLVAASGGGIRAAYWTAKVVDCLIEREFDGADPCGALASPEQVARRRRALMLMSGASGGSLGLAEYVATVGDDWPATTASGTAEPPIETPPVPLNDATTLVLGTPGDVACGDSAVDASGTTCDWVRNVLGKDFLAPVAAAWWFTDGISTFLRPESGVDRGATLERAWERANPNLQAGFFAAQRAGAQPILLMNGYSALTGCRVLTSVVRLASGGPRADCTAATATNPEFAFEDATDVVADVPADTEGGVELATTLDFRSFCRHRDIRFSTAALNSARFPLVSPAGHLDACLTNGTALDPSSSAQVVDGGYRENTGSSTIVEMWPQIADAVTAATVAERGAECVRPIFVQIDNGYNDRTPVVGDAESAGVLTPLAGELNLAAGNDASARQRAFAMFAGSPNDQQLWFHIQTFSHPGSAAPLGWVLSNDAMDDLDAELKNNAEAIAAIRGYLDRPQTLQC